ncbi:uncharacterized protein LOC129600673 [Paramacrobiotus metropolitanus]|uniref:uncharacterized protein LOC129600673 n=1 Tax=Paramacrobiotus metropolitanus TaxID=2943436 RepID=UPI002445FA93|nr:uncharacterized protein LOC129600673 [Paramacrobiotus metropolitanus]
MTPYTSGSNWIAYKLPLTEDQGYSIYVKPNVSLQLQLACKGSVNNVGHRMTFAEPSCQWYQHNETEKQNFSALPVSNISNSCYLKVQLFATETTANLQCQYFDYNERLKRTSFDFYVIEPLYWQEEPYTKLTPRTISFHCPIFTTIPGACTTWFIRDRPFSELQAGKHGCVQSGYNLTCSTKTAMELLPVTCVANTSLESLNYTFHQETFDVAANCTCKTWPAKCLNAVNDTDTIAIENRTRNNSINQHGYNKPLTMDFKASSGTNTDHPNVAMATSAAARPSDHAEVDIGLAVGLSVGCLALIGIVAGAAFYIHRRTASVDLLDIRDADLNYVVLHKLSCNVTRAVT